MLFSYVGPVLRFVVSEWLVLAAVAPFVALLHAAWLGVSGEKDTSGKLRRTGHGALAVSAALVVWQASQLEDARWVVQNVARLARIGQLDAAIELLLDPASAALVLVVLGVAAASLHVLPAKSLVPRAAILVHLATAGAVLAVLADDAIVSMLGIGMVAAAATIASGKFLGIARVADVLLVIAVAFVFWSFGGRRSEGHWVGDLSPRVVALSSTHSDVDEEGEPIHVDASGKVESRPKSGRPSPKDTAFLSVDALPGSWVFVDDSHTPFGPKGIGLRTPFSGVPMPAGVHGIRIHPAQGLDDYVTPQVFFDAGQEVRLTLLGPTFTYRLANAQAAYEPPTGAHPKRDETLLAIGLVALALSVVLRTRDASEPIVIAATLACGMVLVRFAPLVHASQAAWIVAILGAGSAAAAAASATRAANRRDAFRDLATASMGTAVCASAIGSGAAAAAALVLGGAGLGALLLAPRERTASLVATAALSGAPIPIVGQGWVLAGAYAPSLGGSPLLAVLLVALGGACAWATSFALWKFLLEGEKKRRKDVPIVVLAAAAVVLPTVLAYSPRLVGAEADGPIASFVAPSAPFVGTPAFACALLLAGAAVAGRMRAQRRKKVAPKPSILGLELFARASGPAARAFELAGAIATALEVHVIRFAASAIGGLAFAGGWLAVRVEESTAPALPGARIAGAAARLRPTARRVAVFVAVVLALLLGASFARASGRVSLHTEDGRRGPVELVESNGAFQGRFVVENTGASPLSVSRLALREDDAVRAARGLSVKWDGPAPATIPPQASKRVDIEWKPDATMGPSEVVAHVVLTTSDEDAGEVAMGVHAQLPGPLGPFEGHLLSLVIFLPLLGAIAALGIALVFPQGNARIMRIVALACTFAQLALVVVVVRRFVPDFSRLSGNDGLQLVERATWIRPLGVEWYVGVDGAAVLVLVLVSLLGALGVLVSRVEKEVEGHFGVHLVAIAAASGACVARDLVLFVMFVGVASLASAILVGAFGTRSEARRSAGTMAAFMVLSLVALVLCALALRHGSTRSFLADGSTAAHTFAMPELERVAYTRGIGSIAGVPLVDVAFVSGLVGFGLLAGMFPLHAWMPDAAAGAPATFLATVIVPRLGMIGFIRVLAQVLPEATRWASTALIGLGAITILHAGACLVAERDLAKIAARFTIVQAGLVLVGIGSATPQGLAAASTIVLAGGLASALILLVASALDSRIGSCDAGEIGGLIHEAPMLAAVGIAGLLGAGALPGTAPFWGSFLAILGAAPTQPVLAIIVALGVALAATSGFRTMARAFFGTVPEHWRRSTALEPFGGKFPDLRTPEAWAAGSLAVLVVVLGVWPAPMLDVLAGFVRDAVARANLGPLQLGF